MDDDLQLKIETYLDVHWDEVVADIDALVRVDSVEDLSAAVEGAPYGPGPREALSRALSIADRMGLVTHDCEGHIGYADLPGLSDTQIGIIGHVDVVPAGAGWSFPPYEVTRKDGYLVGRGVLDDKGPIVVALHAVKFWKDQETKLPYTVRVLFGANEESNMKDVAYYRAHHDDPAFLFTPDNQFPLGYGESGICNGTLESDTIVDGSILELEGGQAVNAVPGRARAVVRCDAPLLEKQVGEGRITASMRSDGAWVVDAYGKSAHASTPELGLNAIGLLVDYLIENSIGSESEQAFMKVLHQLHDSSDGSGLGIACSDGHFGALTAVGGVIALKDNRIQQSVDFRYPTTITSSEIEHRVNDAVSGFGATFRMEHGKEPFLMDPTSPAVRALLDAYNEVTGERRSGMTSKGGTYARAFTRGVSFGVEKPWLENPNWVGTMHGPDEAVSEDVLKQSFAIFARAIGKLMTIKL